MDWAEERARGDIKFTSIGGNSLKLNPEQAAAVAAALVFYARNGAAEAFDGLSRNNKLAADLSA